MSLQKSSNTTTTDDTSEKSFVFSWRRFMLHSSIVVAGLLLGLLTWYFSKPQSVRFHETKVDEYLTVAVTPDIEISLDKGSSIAVTDNQPMLMEQFKGNVFFSFKKNVVEKFRIKVGEVTIEDAGGRFSIRMNKDGSRIVSVTEGQLQIRVASGTYLVSALEQADFDDFSFGRHRLIAETEVAPWLFNQSQGF